MLYELAQEGGRRRGGAGGVGGRWGAEAKESCIYEGIPGHLCNPEVRRSYDGVCKAVLAIRQGHAHETVWPVQSWEEPCTVAGQ